MNSLKEISELVKKLNISDFTRLYPNPYLLRYLTQEELNQADKDDPENMFDDQHTQRKRLPEFEMTDRFESYRPILRAEATTLARLSEPMHRFACYPIIKSTRNAFPYGPTVGRTANNDIVVALPVVSKFHCWLQKQPDGAWYAYDARSRFGTFVDGLAVSPEGDQGKLLRPGGALRLGDVSLLFIEAVSIYSWISMKLRTGI